MRIRKSQVPFPMVALTADPDRISRSPVVVQLSDAATTTTSPKPSCTRDSSTAPIPSLDRSQPSDQPVLPPIGKPTDGCDGFSGDGGAHIRQQKKQEYLVEDEDGRGPEVGGGHKGNDTRKGCILGSETPLEVPSPSSHLKQDGGWCQGEKAIPLKKRRRGFENVQENNSNNDNNNNNNNNNKKMNKIKTRMKTKLNNEQECLVQDDIMKEEEAADVDEKGKVRESKPDVKVSKKRVRGGALMEGSRCSRVNGRGWRCCQQTLVGYSLCEHHLGKGRLRSMTSVRSRSIATTTAITTTSAPKKLHQVPLSGASSSSSLHDEKQTKCVTDHDPPLGNNDGEDNDEKKPVMATKKKMKLGMVKARSISSLLGQANTEIAIPENNK